MEIKINGKRNYLIQIKVTREQKEKIVALAVKKNKTITTFILDRCLNSDFEEEINFKLNQILKNQKGGENK